MGIPMSWFSVESGCRGVGGLVSSGRWVPAVNIQSSKSKQGAHAVSKDARTRVLCIPHAANRNCA